VPAYQCTVKFFPLIQRTQESSDAAGCDKPKRLDRANGIRVFGMGANFAAPRLLFKLAGTFDEALGDGGPLLSALRSGLSQLPSRARGWPALLRTYGFGGGAGR
jgi:hypothetical protein